MDGTWNRCSEVLDVDVKFMMSVIENGQRY